MRGRIVSLPSKQAVDDIGMIRAAARQKLQQLVASPFGDNDLLWLDIRHHVRRDTLTIRVTKIGELPTDAKARRYTQRDCHGMIDTVADALQGVLYKDDRMVDTGTWGRLRPGRDYE